MLPHQYDFSPWDFPMKSSVAENGQEKRKHPVKSLSWQKGKNYSYNHWLQPRYAEVLKSHFRLKVCI